MTIRPFPDRLIPGHLIPGHLAGLLLAFVVASFSLAGCDGGGDAGEEPAATASVRVFHASADAGDLTVLSGEDPVVTSLPFRRELINPSVSSYAEVSVGSALEVQGASGAAIVRLGAGRLEENVRYTLVVAGAIADGAAAGQDAPQALLLRDDLPDLAGNEAAFRIVHGAAGAPPFDVFWEPPQDTAQAENRIADALAYTETLPDDAPSGAFDVRGVPEGGRILTVPTAADVPTRLPIGTPGQSLSPGRAATIVFTNTEPDAGFPVAALVLVD